MNSHDVHPAKSCTKSVDRCADKLFALLDEYEQRPGLTPQQQQAIYDEIVSWLQQVGDDTFTSALRRLYALAAREAQDRAALRRGFRSYF